MEANWDLHKENVQPLPQGRKVNELGRFLTAEPNSDDVKKREETRKEFEDLLRCDNDDKLAIWYDYINWVEQNYPEGGEEANLKKLIENCISDLFSIQKYHQEERFFRIFLRYTRIVNDALELFNIMFNSNIFTSIAAFYVNWANLVEKNLSKAEEIIQLGLDKLASPKIQLELALREIQMMATENKDDELEEEDVRKPFVPLKVEKKKSGKTLAPVERLGNYEQKNYKLSTVSAQQSNNKNGQIKIFTDENGSEKNDHREVINKLPTSNNQENVTKAGRWCDNKIKSKPRLDQPQSAKFEIQEDEQSVNSQEDIEIKSKQANKLKEIKKDGKEKSPRLVIFEKLAPNQRFYCDLKKIYCGGTEYSFEEIRSIRQNLARKKEKERLTKEQLIKEVQDLKKQVSAKDDLVNDVERMKKKLEDLMKTNSKFKSLNPVDIDFRPISHSVDNKVANSNASNGGDYFNRIGGKSINTNDNRKIDSNETHCTSEKQAKLESNLLMNNDPDPHDDRKNGNEEQQNSPMHFKEFKEAKEDLTIVRNLWNGSIEDETIDIEREIIQKPQSNDFSIFVDDDVNSNKNFINKLQEHKVDPPSTVQQYSNDLNNIQSTNFHTDDTKTFALPHGDFDFVAKHASTPAYSQYNASNTLDENCTISVFQGRDSNKLLSPIVETSKEYKSSSSSSLSGFSSYHKSKTFHK